VERLAEHSAFVRSAFLIFEEKKMLLTLRILIFKVDLCGLNFAVYSSKY